MSAPFPTDQWIIAWKLGVDAFWPDEKPTEIQRLLAVRESALFTAPERMFVRVNHAWNIYINAEDDTPIARAAVALAYILAAGARR